MSKYALLFTGQGAQYPGMGKDLYEKYNLFKNIFDEASEHLKINLINICSDAQELSKTHNAQATIFTLSYAIYKLLAATCHSEPFLPTCHSELYPRGGESEESFPNYAAGFSLGEITSFAAAEILTFKDTLELIKVRGKVMQEACDHKPGSMYSVIGADDKLVEEICANINGYVIPANYNCPGQIVISGETEAVEQAVKIFAENKIRTIKLNVAGAFHSELMRYKETELIGFLKTLNFNEPEFDLYSNITGEKFNFDNNKNIKSFMINYIPKQMSSPVRFKTEIENIEKAGCDLFIEIGAGKVLSGFVKRTCENARFTNIQDAATFESTLELMQK